LILFYSSSYLLPSMYDGFICSQSRQRQGPDFGANAHLLSVFSLFRELNIVL
jgi:hypothetical protein